MTAAGNGFLVAYGTHARSTTSSTSPVLGSCAVEEWSSNDATGRSHAEASSGPTDNQGSSEPTTVIAAPIAGNGVTTEPDELDVPDVPDASSARASTHPTQPLEKAIFAHPVVYSSTCTWRPPSAWVVGWAAGLGSDHTDTPPGGIVRTPVGAVE